MSIFGIIMGYFKCNVLCMKLFKIFYKRIAHKKKFPFVAIPKKGEGKVKNILLTDARKMPVNCIIQLFSSNLALSRAIYLFNNKSFKRSAVLRTSFRLLFFLIKPMYVILQ